MTIITEALETVQVEQLAPRWPAVALSLEMELGEAAGPRGCYVWRVHQNAEGRWFVVLRQPWADGGYAQAGFSSPDLVELLSALIAYLEESEPVNILEMSDRIKYLSGSMVKDRTFTAEIARVTSEEMPGGDKCAVLHLKDRRLPIALNAGNTRRLIEAWGYESTDWHGHSVRVSAYEGTFFKRRTWALRIEPTD